MTETDTNEALAARLTERANELIEIGAAISSPKFTSLLFDTGAGLREAASRLQPDEPAGIDDLVFVQERERAAPASNSAVDGAIERSCTCHPDDNPPKPCAGKFALSECLAAENAALRGERDERRETDLAAHRLLDKVGAPTHDDENWPIEPPRLSVAGRVEQVCDGLIAERNRALASEAREAALRERVEVLEADAGRYRFLRDRDAGPTDYTPPGLFIGRVPENLILTGEDADRAIDAALSVLPSRGDEGK